MVFGISQNDNVRAGRAEDRHIERLPLVYVLAPPPYFRSSPLFRYYPLSFCAMLTYASFVLNSRLNHLHSDYRSYVLLAWAKRLVHHGIP